MNRCLSFQEFTAGESPTALVLQCQIIQTYSYLQVHANNFVLSTHDFFGRPLKVLSIDIIYLNTITNSDIRRIQFNNIATILLQAVICPFCPRPHSRCMCQARYAPLSWIELSDFVWIPLIVLRAVKNSPLVCWPVRVFVFHIH
jgi:hypothetical protein